MDNSQPQFPVAPRAFDGASRAVEAGACFDWLRQGWALFAANPGIWIACAILTLILLLGVSIVPLVGQLAVHILMPILGAGLLHLCRKQSEGDSPEIPDLFIGFKEKTSSLVMIGVTYMLGILFIAFLVAVIVGGGVAGGVVNGTVMGFGLMIGSFLLGTLLIAILAIPLVMAMWFSPALVFFNGMAPVEAMKASFHACLKNWLPFLVYGLILFILFFFSALLLGLGFLVLLPVFAGALHASYRDVFLVV